METFTACRYALPIVALQLHAPKRTARMRTEKAVKALLQLSKSYNGTIASPNVVNSPDGLSAVSASARAVCCHSRHGDGESTWLQCSLWSHKDMQMRVHMLGREVSPNQVCRISIGRHGMSQPVVVQTATAEYSRPIELLTLHEKSGRCRFS